MKTITKKLFISSLIFSFVAGLMPSYGVVAEDAPDVVADALSAAIFPTHFWDLEMRWGNVLGEPESTQVVDMNGSITVSGGKIAVLEKLLFEDHDAMGTTTETSIAWTSKIYGHWDGLLIRGSAPKDATVTIMVGSTTVTKSVADFVRLKKEVTDLGSGRELVLQVRPVREPAVVLQAFWGRVGHREAAFTPDQKTSAPLMVLGVEGTTEDQNTVENNEIAQTGTKVPPPTLNTNFNGSFTFGGSTIKFAKPVSFEPGDVLNAPSGETVSWTSNIKGAQLPANFSNCTALRDVNTTAPCPVVRFDRDGIILGSRPSVMSAETTFTVRFTDPALNFNKTFTLKDLWHKKFIFEPVPVNGQNVGLGLVVQFHVLQDGKLVRAKGRPDVFRIEDGEKRHVLSPEAFRLNNFKWENIQEVEPEEVDALPESYGVDIPEGTPVKGRGPAVFVTSEEGLCPVASPQAFEAVGLHWEDVVPVPEETINARPKCKTIDGAEDIPDGVLVRGQGQSSVFRTDNGSLMPVPNPDVFKANGFRWDRVKEVPQALIASRKQSAPVSIPDGTLVRGQGPSVFVIEQGKRRPFPDADDFNGAGLDWDDIHQISDSVLNSVPRGASVVR